MISPAKRDWWNKLKSNIHTLDERKPPRVASRTSVISRDGTRAASHGTTNESAPAGGDLQKKWQRPEVGDRVKLSELGLSAPAIVDRGWNENIRATVVETRYSSALAVQIDGREEIEHFWPPLWVKTQTS